MKKILLLFMLSAVLSFSGCGNSSDQETTSAQPVREKNVSFFTGEETTAETYTRPVAVTVNNIEASLPQYGTGGADIIMEFPVEGGITRLMALYGDYKNVPEVCSVRSCRYYFPIFARGFDAVYFCFGSNETLATPTLERLGIDHIDGNKAGDSLVFDRDEERLGVYSTEHTVYLKGTNMAEIFANYGFSEKRDEALGKTAFDFSGETVSFPFECKGITGSFSSSYASAFYYDEVTGKYRKNHNGQAHIDGRSGEQLSFENVFLLEAETSKYEDTSLVVIDWHGGRGYYATKGTVAEIYWEKESENAPLRFFDAEKNPLKINKGKSYIGIGAEVILSNQIEVQ